MTTQNKPTIPIRRPLTMYYIGRPASLYIDAMAKHQRTHANGRRAQVESSNN